MRPVAAADASAIASILNAFVSTTMMEWTDTPQSVDSILGWLDEYVTVLVAEDGHQVVGVAAFGWYRDVVKRPGYRFTVDSTVTYGRIDGVRASVANSWAPSSTRQGEAAST